MTRPRTTTKPPVGNSPRQLDDARGRLAPPGTSRHPTLAAQRNQADEREAAHSPASSLAAATSLLRMLRFPAVHDRTGLSRSTVWRLERAGSFPRHRRLSANTVAWAEDEVDAWIRERIGA